MSDDTTGKETTVTEPVIKDEKPETVPYSRLSEMAAQKNAAKAEAEEARAELDKIKADREKVREAELEKQGEYKTLLEEANAKITNLTTELGGVKTKWDTHEAKRRETVNSIEGLTEDDKKFMADLGIDAAEAFAVRVANVKPIIGTDTRRSATHNGDAKPLKSFAEMTDKEKRDTHTQRLAQYTDK